MKQIKFNYQKSLLLLVIILFENKLFSMFSLFQNKPNINLVKINIDGMYGNIPYDLDIFIKNIKNKKFKEIDELQLNRLLLYGPPGNGKSTIARVIAKQIDAEFLELKGSTVVGKYQGSGAERIITLFNNAHDIYNIKSKKVVVFIDEVDAFASNNNISEAAMSNRRDHESAVQTLWQYLDEVKSMQDIIVILATNKYKELNGPLKDRFRANQIEILNPDESMRKELIEGFIKKYERKFDKITISELAKKTNDYSIRSIEDAIMDMQKIARANKKNTIDSFIVNHVIDKFNKSKEEISGKSLFERISLYTDTTYKWVIILSGITSIIYKCHEFKNGNMKNLNQVLNYHVINPII